MNTHQVERDALRAYCAVVKSALPHLPDDPGLAEPIERARRAVATAQGILARSDGAEPLAVDVRLLLALGLERLDAAGYSFERLHSYAEAGPLVGSPTAPKAAHALADLVQFACVTALDGTYFLEKGLRQRRALKAADEAFHEAEKHIWREAREDWPAFCRRLAELGRVLAGLGVLDIQLHSFGVRRDVATTPERHTAQGRKAKRAKPR